MMKDLPTFDEFVDELPRRLGAADALKPSELHDFHELMSDYTGSVEENRYSDAFDELEAQGISTRPRKSPWARRIWGRKRGQKGSPKGQKGPPWSGPA
jgi:hypothetical protein